VRNGVGGDPSVCPSSDELDEAELAFNGELADRDLAVGAAKLA
jgi:hypothetical protein